MFDSSFQFVGDFFDTFLTPGHLRPVIIKPVGRILELSDSNPIRGEYARKCGRSLSPQEKPGSEETPQSGKHGKRGWLYPRDPPVLKILQRVNLGTVRKFGTDVEQKLRRGLNEMLVFLAKEAGKRHRK